MDLPQHEFPSRDAMEAFLDTHHETSPGFFAKLAKKTSGIPSVNKDEATEVALCFGWIDGGPGGRSLDADWYLMRFQPRRRKGSLWSRRNVETVERLLAGGPAARGLALRPAGQRAVDEARADGRWERAYAGPASIEVPEDLGAALEAEPAARELFQSLKGMERYSVLFQVHTASATARPGKIERFVEMLARGEKPKTFGPKKKAPAGKTKVAAENKVVKSGSKKKAQSKVSAAPKKVTAKPEVKTETQSESSSISGEPRRPGLRPRR